MVSKRKRDHHSQTASKEDAAESEDASDEEEEDEDEEQEVEEKAQAKSKGNAAKINQPTSSKRQTKKQQKEAEVAAKYGEYFDTQEDDKDAAAGPKKDGDRGGASSRDAMDDGEEGM